MMANQVDKDLIEGRYAGKRTVVFDKTSYSITSCPYWGGGGGVLQYSWLFHAKLKQSTCLMCFQAFNLVTFLLTLR